MLYERGGRVLRNKKRIASTRRDNVATLETSFETTCHEFLIRGIQEGQDDKEQATFELSAFSDVFRPPNIVSEQCEGSLVNLFRFRFMQW